MPTQVGIHDSCAAFGKVMDGVPGPAMTHDRKPPYLPTNDWNLAFLRACQPARRPSRAGLAASLHQNHEALSTTLRNGPPAANARQLSTMIANRRSFRYGPYPAICGVSSTFGIPHSGCSAGSGSCS